MKKIILYLSFVVFAIALAFIFSPIYGGGKVLGGLVNNLIHLRFQLEILPPIISVIMTLMFGARVLEYLSETKVDDMKWWRVVMAGLAMALASTALTMVIFLIGFILLVIGAFIKKEIVDFLSVFQNQ